MKKSIVKRIISTILVASTITVGIFTSTACEKKKDTIGIVQFGSHLSLNNCYDGVMKGLAESGVDTDAYNIEHLNSNFDPAVAQSQCARLVNEGAKVIIAIATPSAVAAANAAADDNIPVVFCAVTDSSVMANYKNVTGSSDLPDFDKCLATVTKTMGREELSVGVLYSTDESSSPFQLQKLTESAKNYSGMQIKSRAVADITTIDTQVNALISDGVDCFVNLLDNTIVGKLESNILPLTDAAGIPVFGSEIEQVKVGCVAAASIDYVEVGRAAGSAAAEILSGKSVADIPVSVITDPTVCYNGGRIEKFSLNVPSDMDAVRVDND